MVNNVVVFPCNAKKRPTVEGWQTYSGECRSPVVGVVVPRGVVIIDVDVYKGVELSAIDEVLGCNLAWGEAELQTTLNGGKHYAFSLPDGVEVRQGSNLLGVEGFDTRVAGKGYICTGEGYIDETLFGVVETLKEPDLLAQLPQTAIDALAETVSDNLGGESGDDELAVFEAQVRSKGLGLSDNEIRDYLAQLPDIYKDDQDHWYQVGMSVYHETGGSEQGWLLFDEWSKGGKGYDQEGNILRWRSFGRNRGKVRTFASVIKVVNDTHKVESVDAVSQLCEQVGELDEKSLKTTFVDVVRGAKLDRLAQGQVVAAMQARFKSLTGVKPAIADVRRLLGGSGVTEQHKPEWCEPWVYVNSHCKFMNTESLEIVGAEGFNIRYGKLVPMNENGAKQSAVRHVADNGFIDTVAKTAYLPMVDDVICSTDGGDVLNTFNKRSLPAPALEYTDEGLRHIGYIKDHFKLIFGDDENTQIFIQWLAHQVQRPGVKIPWAPLIQSIQGVGKSLIARLLEGVLGTANVGAVSPKVVVSDFNGWATGKVVNVLEELRMQGHNRHEAANAVKPLITDKYITINEKGINAYVTPNTANYIAFTNFKDCVPLDGSDRRWWVTYVTLNCLDDIETLTGLAHEDYFDRVWDAVRHHCAEVKKWLLSVEISPEFEHLTTAPTTVHKQLMIATETNGPEWAEEIGELIDKGGEFFTNNAVSSKDLFDQAMFDIDGFQQPSNQIKARILKSLGYSRLPKPIKVRGEVKRFWVKNHMTNEDIRAEFPF